jgi:hypothetical protein
MTYRIKNWQKHQHFKDRRPPWIKLYRDLLDDKDWHSLSGDAAKFLVMVWLLASEDKDQKGQVPDVGTLAFRLRTSEATAKQLLEKLSQWVMQDDINLSSTCHQVGPPETETEGEKRQSESESETRGGSIKESLKPEQPAPPPPSKPVEPEDHPLVMLAQKIRGCRPEYNRLQVSAIIHTLRYFKNDPRLEWFVNEWTIDHANALEPFNQPLASLRKSLGDTLATKPQTERRFQR